jgi:hypothetical protein
MWHFFDEGSSNEDVLDEVRAAQGFCAQHADQLKRIEVDDTRSTVGISEVYAYTLEGLLADMQAGGNVLALPSQAERHRWPARRARAVAPASDGGQSAVNFEACPACVYRDRGVAQNARYLLEELLDNSSFLDSFAASPGLCLPHFRLAWSFASSDELRSLLCKTELDAVEALLAELREHLRKQRHEFRHEPRGTEQDSWQRAIYLTSGWPPPGESAAVPEIHGREHPVSHAAR